MKKALLLLAALSLCGCACYSAARKNNQLMLTLNIGQTTQEVTKIMGNPVRNEKYSSAGGVVDVWYYRTDCDLWAWDDDDLTPMVFKNGKLAGWGQNFYMQEVELRSGLK